MDLSHKDSKYFLDHATYNCPFCRRGGVGYYVTGWMAFDISAKQTHWAYLTTCRERECGRASLHLSKYRLEMTRPVTINQIRYWNFTSTLGAKSDADDEYVPIQFGDRTPEIDELFYAHIPGDEFTIDQRIPVDIKAPLVESRGCLKNNYLTGASAGLRKAIYKLLKDQNIPEVRPEVDKGFYSHDERVDLLIEKYHNNAFVDDTTLGHLKGVHILTSQELHENDWEDYSSAEIKFFAQLINDVVIQIYIRPAEAEQKKKQLNELRHKAGR